MKVSTFSEIIVALLLSGSVFLVGCSDPQKQASKELKAKGYEVTVKDFLVAASAGAVSGVRSAQEMPGIEKIRSRPSVGSGGAEGGRVGEV